MIDVDPDSRVIDIPHLGITLRTLLAVAAQGYEDNPKRLWKVRYKDVVIGSVRVRSNSKELA